jgi:hypothetical protein
MLKQLNLVEMFILVKKINNGMKISETDAKTNAPALQTIGTAT